VNAPVRPRLDIAAETEIRAVGADQDSSVPHLADFVQPRGELIGHPHPDPVLWRVVQHERGESVIDSALEMGHQTVPSSS
jgi:hypothetical protein